MCGICGQINFNGKRVGKTSILSMMDLIKHRGPDDEGHYIDGNIGVGHVRLSIVDLTSAGHQPMFSQDRRYCIVHNGEVYNYIEIRNRLKHKYQFHSKTDTEVILNAFIEWGEECLNLFNGMFAFAIYDSQKRKLFIARDRFGIKPLYYYVDKEKFIFSSEIPSLLKGVGKIPTQNYQAIFDYLAFSRTDQTNETFFKEIKKLQHGHFLKINESELKIFKWYNLEEHINDSFNNPFEYKELLSDSLRLRLRSDVPVGVCLSGGLDSSSVVSLLLNDFHKSDLNTFSANYGANEEGDESKYIAEYETILKNMYYVTPSADSLFNDKESLVKAHAEPFPGTSPYAQYKVMETAKEHVVVTLDGQGADEQLAGYHYFFGFYFKELLQKFKYKSLFSETLGYYKKHKSVYAFKTMAYFLLPKYLQARVRATYEHGYLDRKFVNQYMSSNQTVDNIYNSKGLTKSLIDHFEYKLEHLLKWADRNSMHFSLESRVPFLDYRLVEKTIATPSNMIIRNGFTKHILRDSMRGILPEKIRLRVDKMGFSTPEDKWFRTPKFKEYIQDIISSQKFASLGYINQKKALQLYQKHCSGEIKIAREIWKWINLSMWHDIFFQNSSD